MGTLIVGEPYRSKSMRSVSWNGYEIDGSDTSFEVAVADIAEARRMAVVLLEHPLWDRSLHAVIRPELFAPHRDEEGRVRTNRTASNESMITIEEAIRQVAAGNLDNQSIVLEVTDPYDLDPQLLEKVTRHSANRVPPEPELSIVKTPELLPDGCWFARAVGLTISATPASHFWSAIRCPSLAEELLAQSRCGIKLTLGPPFIYEYAMELIDTVRAHFPGVEVSGGLDCKGGWTEGCTYAATLYPFGRRVLEGPLDHVLPRILTNRFISFPASCFEKFDGDYLLDSILFAKSGELLLRNLKRPEIAELAPQIESFIGNGYKTSFDGYVDFSRRVAGKNVARAVKNELTLAYICLPRPEDLPSDVGEQYRQRQFHALPEHSIEFEWNEQKELVDWREFVMKDLFEAHNRVAWIGLDRDVDGRVAIWVRPLLKSFAENVLDYILTTNKTAEQ